MSRTLSRICAIAQLWDVWVSVCVVLNLSMRLPMSDNPAVSSVVNWTVRLRLFTNNSLITPSRNGCFLKPLGNLLVPKLEFMISAHLMHGQVILLSVTALQTQAFAVEVSAPCSYPCEVAIYIICTTGFPWNYVSIRRWTQLTRFLPLSAQSWWNAWSCLIFVAFYTSLLKAKWIKMKLS